MDKMSDDRKKEYSFNTGNRRKTNRKIGIINHNK